MLSQPPLQTQLGVPSLAPRPRGRRPAWPVIVLAAFTVSGCGWPQNQTAASSQVPTAAVVRTATVAPRAAPRQPAMSKVNAGQRASASSLPVVKPADFGAQRPSRDARHVADWVLDSWDNEGKSFVLVDKKDARVYVFNQRGKLVGAAPALIGAAVGDDAVPGIGDKPLSQVLPEEKTTPAGRFVAEPGTNAGGEDVVWVSWDLAVSMHRVRPLVKAERRLQRLASPTPKDNRISFGCINLPVAFYERVLRPTVKRDGAIIYVLPETRTPQQQFGSYDVRERASRVASRNRPQVAGLAPPTVK